MTNLSIRAISNHIEDCFSDEKPERLELSLFKLKDGKMIDIGSMCYQEFAFDSSGKNHASYDVWLTNLATYDERRLNFLGAFIDSMRLKNNLKPTSKRKFILKIMRFICWIGAQSFDVDFGDISEIKKAYEEYTKWLYHRIKLKDDNPLKISNNAASYEQKAARFACALMAGTDVKTVEYWAMPIRLSDKEKFSGTLTISPTTDEDRFSTYAALCDFIHQAWNLWGKKESDAIKVNDVTLYCHLDLYNESRREELYNKVVVAALMSFIGASGANLQVALGASLDKFDYGLSEKNTRMAGVKSRAGGKTVYPEFAAKYLNIWKKWLDIREMWLASHGSSSDAAFPYLGMGEVIKPLPSSLTDVTKPAASMFMRHYSVKWITARNWRGFKSKLLGKASNNDVFAAAQMQGHSVKTAITNYANRNLADAAKEISVALNAVYVSAIARCRNKAHIPISIVETTYPDQVTVIGVCQSETELAPVIADGFTLFAPQPDCSIKETCLFCDKYAAHADEKDVRKLLSFSFLVNELSKTIPHAEWARRWPPYLHRVNEILEQMKSAQPGVVAIIDKITEEIEYGELDEFWLDYYETLTHLGVVLA